LIYDNLTELLENAFELELTEGRRLVIFSDLHIGNRGRTDDFLNNSQMFHHVLKHFYLPAGYGLILNGDIEELQRFDIGTIEEKWQDLYLLLDEFQKSDRLWKTVGNHDSELMVKSRTGINRDLMRAIRLRLDRRYIFVYHGHQASVFFNKFNRLSGYVLRFIANPLGIKNYSVSQDNRKKFRTEERLYRFSSKKKVISIIGHTHRPLFESLSKVDTLKYAIEDLINKFPTLPTERREAVKQTVRMYLSELRETHNRKRQYNLVSTIYSCDVVVPVLFNSGCCIGKRGITCIEINGDTIALNHWFDGQKNSKYLGREDYIPLRLDESQYYRVTLRERTLTEIFTRIELLS
jgi:predicted phosphodiesterase